ncbi:nicotinamide riboside transporter PnuC [Mucilaginibacter lappiensis]|uniref:Nicotinamide riboside transporter PnuC n=1 Tax=Mucilaginibacter lappiensis TaxID=354630 RepID=A0A1N7A812_9SPHI|nr:nicotinamide riboside transporter PnuC [Mucilaginibacter lappiensis]MBB6110473.1 nicotinamide mononucleotide transporter [Mucilaginibacter lappiensis]MBB6128424.1 nicotinamide mononucleotide transporter [Mucilaginibacter lappiensis]SIR35186.1 nicotinamide mononucleotide transporter [Mucilaginibacter lappiensis]
MHSLLNLFIEQIRETTWVQWLAVVLGVAEVLLARVNNIWLYPAGILGTALSILLLMEAQLYAESLLNVYYIVMSVYGWIYWIKKRDQPSVKVTWSTKTEWIISLSISLGGWAVLYFLLRYFTPSNVPLWDAFVSSTAWAGMWLLARRKIENWIFLNISNLFAVPLLFYKKLPMFAALTIFLFIVACFGYFDWKRKAVKKDMRFET